MRFGILGPLRVGDGKRDGSVTAGRDRVVVAMLLLRPNRIVPVDELVDAMWDDGPPATARGQLQSCVSRVRRVLAAAGVPAGMLRTDPAGYSLTVAEDDLDATVFARLTEQARACAGDRPQEAARLFQEALALWRGPALAGITSRAVRQRAAVLDEQLAAAIEDRIDIDLRLGREREVLGELTGLVQRYPLRERLRAQLMVALYRAGRQADALTEYRAARQALQDELGVEPGAPLRRLHQAILVGEVDGPGPHGGAAPDGGGAAPDPGVPPVRCLPRTVPDFTGRAEVVDRLLRAVREADQSSPVIALIDGMAGSGKTTLAVHLANLAAALYPDAQLFVNLHGYSERSPVEPAAALVTLLRQLGVPGERIPADVDERIALWRTELANRRALILLDNVASTAQLSPLLPAAAHCLVLVTSRRRLTGLDGVRPESLPLFSEGEAVEMLARVGGARVLAEPDAAVEVVRRCGLLPLAIRLAGARLAHRPRWRVADLASRLGEHGAALPELAAEDRTVASAFALSYSHLAPPAQQLFRMVSFHPGGNFDALAAAALADVGLSEARDLLDELVDGHLVEEPAPARYRMHDLVREYAGSLARSDPQADRAAASRRLLDFYLHAIAAVTGPIEGEGGRHNLRLPEPARPDLLAAHAGTEDWLEGERPGLVALVDRALETGHYGHAWRLARAAWLFLFLRGYNDDLIETHQRGLAGARAEGDEAAAATMLNYLASAYYRTGRYEEALAHLQQAVELLTRLGDERGRAATLANLGIVYEVVGRLAEALATSELALQSWRRLGEAYIVADGLSLMAAALAMLGRDVEALRWHRIHLQLACESRYGVGVAAAMGNLGALRLRLGDTDVAVRLLLAALRLKRQNGNRFGEAEVLNHLGTARRAQGRYPEAVEYHREALRIMREMGERRGDAMVSNDLAGTLRAMGDLDAAVRLHRRALALAEQLHSPYERARALDGLARSVVATEPGSARRYWAGALALYRSMGVPERLEVERRLAEMDDAAG